MNTYSEIMRKQLGTVARNRNNSDNMQQLYVYSIHEHYLTFPHCD